MKKFVYYVNNTIQCTQPSKFRRCLYDDCGHMILGSACTLVTLLRRWIRHFTMIISAWWLQISRNLRGKNSNVNRKNLEKSLLLSGCRFVQRIARPSLSRDEKIKMHQSIIISNNIFYSHCIQETGRPTLAIQRFFL